MARRPHYYLSRKKSLAVWRTSYSGNGSDTSDKSEVIAVAEKMILTMFLFL